MLRTSALLTLALLAAGCLAPGAQLTASGLAEGVRVLDEAGAPVPYASVTLLVGEAPVARLSTDAAGVVPTVAVAFERVLVAATGFEPLTLDALESDIILARASSADALDASPVLRVLPPYDFGGYVFGPEQACDLRNTCGLSEPVLENAPGDVVYASSTCCVGGSPPVWVSRDAGATWDTLDTPGVREAVGIEGDFAVDAAGNVYFTDILVGALWITSWDAEGNWRHTTPVFLPPLVDRPWVRAGAEDVVYFLYNTGTATNFHVSTDGGQTFLPVPTKTFPAGLGTIAQGPELEHLWVVAGGILYESMDGGATWTAGEEVPMPEGASADAGGYGFQTLAVDAAGTVGVAYDLGSEKTGYGIHLATRTTEGAWSVHTVSPVNGTHVMPWVEAGPAGGFVVAWYGIDSEANAPDAVAEDAPWYVFLAATHDAGASWQVARADEESVLAGPMARRLLDFLQVDLDEAGAAHLVYAHNRDGSNDERTSYVRTTIGLGLSQVPPVASAQTGVLDPLSSYGSGALARP